MPGMFQGGGRGGDEGNEVRDGRYFIPPLTVRYFIQTGPVAAGRAVLPSEPLCVHI